MRFLRVLPLLLSVAFIWALNHSFSPAIPALGRLIDPVNGAMAAAEPVHEDWNRHLQLKALKAPVSVWIDTSLIPHIRASNDYDLYFTQGYIHATFRLWQMDLQTRAAWGRISEVAGPKAIEFDRGMRREGMVWGAQHSLAAMEAEPRTKAMLDAYRDGINAYIRNLSFRSLPLEYKLMGFEPEAWTNLRTALLMKYMARDLTGKTDDIAFTLLRDQLGQKEFDFLFPERIKGSKPVIPEGTKWEAPSLSRPSAPGDSVWAHFDTTGLARYEKGRALSEDGPARYEKGPALSKKGPALYEKRVAQNEKGPALFRKEEALSDKGPALFDKRNTQDGNSEGESGIGSNNWAISGSHTASGKPILCNDPHLGLNLPSLWYEMQLTASGINVYGASLPGAPGIVIGFNEKISWGFTNNYRDVKDFYEIIPYWCYQSKYDTVGTPYCWDGSYSFCGKPRFFDHTIEVIKVKGGPDVTDTVLYTIHGPVTYDPSFAPPDAGARRGTFLIACTWMGHCGSNELLATYLLNRAVNYPAFTDAISHFECPAQNIAYADGAGNIAMWGQGRFINKWKGQGKFVMRGTDSSTLWGDAIPWQENPHVLNPPQGYVVSANQQVTDSTYPYWYNGSFTEWRSWEINYLLTDRIFATSPQLDTLYNKTKNILLPHTVCRGFGFKNELIKTEEMRRLQNCVWSLLNFNLISPIHFFATTPNAGHLLHGSGDCMYEGNDILYDTTLEGTRTQIFWSQLYKDIWQDEFPTAVKYPSSEVTVQLLLSDSTSKYYNNRQTQQVETLCDIVQRAFRETTDSLNRLVHNASTSQLFNDSTLQWYKVKNTTLNHLAKIPAFSYDHLKIGGWSNTINACTGNHGPSWRMIVEMDPIPQAYAIYPGGQSGNPGSRHYGDFIDQWVEGKYHAIQFITAAITKNPLAYSWTLSP